MDDEAVFDDLRGLLARADPVPERLHEAARAAFSWRTVDAELAELMRDSAEHDPGAPALRGPAARRLLSFESPRMAIEAEVTVLGPRERRLAGQIIPPVPASVVVEQGGVRLTVQADELGRFAFDRLGAGPARLRATPPEGGMEIATPWTPL
jgi:hypothetical protein